MREPRARLVITPPSVGLRSPFQRSPAIQESSAQVPKSIRRVDEDSRHQSSDGDFKAGANVAEEAVEDACKGVLLVVIAAPLISLLMSPPGGAAEVGRDWASADLDFRGSRF